MKGKKILWWGLGITIFLFAAYIGVGTVIHRQLADVSNACLENLANNRPDNFGVQNAGWDGFDPTPYFMEEYESIRFVSRDPQFEIAGWYVETDPSAPVVILVHGIRSCKNSVTILTPAGMLVNHGYNVLMMDVRDAGESDFEDGFSAIGTEEYLDVLGAWDWLQEEKGYKPEQIGILGNSLGAATTMIAFSEEPQVAALFVDSPFDNLPQIIREELARNDYPTFLYVGSLWAARLTVGDNLIGVNPSDAIRNANGRPIFILHGTGDQRINVQHTYQLQALAKDLGVDNVEIWTPEGIDHVQAAWKLTDEYESRLVGFFDSALK